MRWIKAPLINKSVALETMLCDISWSSKVHEEIETLEKPMKMFLDNLSA
jgi:hypothetical protein